MPATATPPTGQPQAAQGQPQVLPQSFWDDVGHAFSKAVSTVGQVANTAGQVGHAFGLFNAAPQAPPMGQPQAAQGQPAQGQPQVLPQSFWDDLGSVARVAVPIALSLLQVRPQLVYANGQQQASNGAQQAGYAAAPQMAAAAAR